MKRSSFLLLWLSIFSIVLLNIDVSAQDYFRHAIDDRAKWSKFTFPSASILIPRDFVIDEISGVDGTVWRFRNKHLHFSFASGTFVRSSVSTSQTETPGYRKKTIQAGEVVGRAHFYEERKKSGPFVDYPFVSVMFVRHPSIKEFNFVVSLFATDSTGQMLAEEMFATFRIEKSASISESPYWNRKAEPGRIPTVTK